MIVGKCQGFWAMIMGKLTEWAQSQVSMESDHVRDDSLVGYAWGCSADIDCSVTL